MDDALTFQLEVSFSVWESNTTYSCGNLPDVVFSQVVVLGIEGLKSVAANKIVYCTIEVEGEGKLQTEHVEASNAQ